MCSLQKYYGVVSPAHELLTVLKIRHQLGICEYDEQICSYDYLLWRGWSSKEINQYMKDYMLIGYHHWNGIELWYDFQKAREIENKEKELGIRVALSLLLKD